MSFPLGKFPTKLELHSRWWSTGPAKNKEIKVALGKQGFTDYKRITLRKGIEEIQMNKYVLSFNRSKIRIDIKIGYSCKRVEQYI